MIKFIYHFMMNLFCKSFFDIAGFSSLASSISYKSAGSNYYIYFSWLYTSELSFLFNTFGAFPFLPLKIYLKLLISAKFYLYAFILASMFPNSSSISLDWLLISDFFVKSQYCKAEEDAVKMTKAITYR